MKSSEQERLEIENTLKEGNFINKNDSLELTEKGDYWEKFLLFRQQVRGYYYFTKEKIVFLGGLASSTQLSISYKDIKNIKKCQVGLFVPCGILITAFNEKKNKDVKYKLSLLKRDKWIKYIEKKVSNK